VDSLKLWQEANNMAGSENDGAKKQTTNDDVKEEASIYEDEINLMDYFVVLWKRRYFIVLGSVLPALIVGLFFFFLPRNYEVTYVYDVRDDVRDDVSNWNLNEKNYNILINRFYSEENLNKIINVLRENGLNEYAELIRNAGNSLDALKKLLKFEAVPSYTNLSEAKVTDPEQLEQIQKLKAQLLNMTIVGEPKEDILKIASVIRSNLENVIPTYMIQERLSANRRTDKTMMADIESNRFSLELTLKKNKSTLEKLKSIKTQTPDKIESDIILQFDVGGRSEYLPIEYQIQAAESKIIQLEETIKENEEKYKYYKNLLDLNEKLFAEVKNKALSDYTIQQFRLFLLESVKEVEKEELKDYLSSYAKRIENRIAASVPVTENPGTYAVSKGTVKKSAIVFAVALMMSVFVAFLLEGLKKSQAQAS
jgi:uncharacterized protein involved in exopolysaccharide biosynthesis